jgi:DNA-binding transcriptional LysR family regulator
VAPALNRLPGERVTVHGVDDDAALRRLRLGTTDVAIVQEYDHQPIGRDHRFAYTRIARDELRLVLPRRFKRSTTLRDLAGVAWLLNGDGSHCSAAVLRILAGTGVTPTIAGSVDDNHALLRLVAAGHGAGVVPALVLAAGTTGVTVADEPLGAARTLFAVTRRSSGGRADRLVAALVATAEEAGAFVGARPGRRGSRRDRPT